MTGPGDPHDLDPRDLDVGDEATRQACLSAYLDGELSAEDARLVTAWLDQHPDALREVEHQRRVWDLLETYADEPVSDHFAAGVFEAVQIKSGQLVSMAWYRRPLVAAAAGMLIALGASFAFSKITDRVEPQSEDSGVSQETLVALEAVPADLLLDDEALTLIRTLDDEHFEAFVAGDYDDDEDAG